MTTRYMASTVLLGLALGCGSSVSLHDEDIPVPWDDGSAPLRTTRIDSGSIGSVLTVEVARRLAIEQNPEMGMALARVEAARARVLRAVSAYLPQVDAKVGYTHTYDFSMPQLGDAYRSLIPKSFEVYDTTLQGTWLLFDGFVREFNLKAAGLARDETKAAYKDIERLLVRAVEQTYYEGQLAREGLRIAEADASFNRQMFDATEQLRARGKATRPDVNNFEIRLKAAEGNALAARRALAVNYMVLEELLGLAEGTLGSRAGLEPLGEETNDLLARPEEGVWLTLAENTRPDVAMSLFARKRGEAEVGAARSAWFPSLILSGSYGWQKLGDMRYSQDEVNSAVLVGLGWNLFNGFGTVASLREAKARADEASFQIEKRTRAAVSEVRQAVSGVVYAQDRLAIDVRSAALAAETRDDVRKAYEAEKAALTRLNEAQRDAVHADARYAQARILLRQAWSTLKAAGGGQTPR